VGVDGEVELGCELLHKVSNYNDKMKGTRLLDVLNLVLGRDEGVDLGAESDGEEDCAVALW
jgi:hypothetical protein